MSQPKPKKCKVCRTSFVPVRNLQMVCGWKCAVKIAPTMTHKAEVARKKVDRQNLRIAKERLKSRRDYIKEAAFACHAYVRFRDRLLGCVSCGTFDAEQYHAGHYMAAGKRPSLRFDEANIHKQCVQCNMHLHGNLLPYRRELLVRVGVEKVEWLESQNIMHLWTVGELKEIRDFYRAKLKQLKEEYENEQ